MKDNYTFEDPSWVTEDGKINEVELASFFLKGYEMSCVNGILFDKDGMITDLHYIEQTIFEMISPYVTTNIPRRIGQIMDTIRLLSSKTYLPTPDDVINVANGTLTIDGRFSPDKEICANRIPVAYNLDAPRPQKWLEFLNDLLYPEDIATLQEFMGYCLIPTNRAQKMLIIIGNGGEGKSRVGLVMKALLGDNMNTGDIQKLENNRFSLANLEYKLLMLDDDMTMEALSKTNVIKSVVTLEGKTELERKGKQSVQGYIYSRIMLIGNGSLSALHDRSFGFFRRQILLEVKPREADRIDDPFLIDKLKDELEGIFLWCFEGLKNLIANDYRFSVSKRADDNLRQAMEDGNNVIQFMQSEGYIRIEPKSDQNSEASGKNICMAYRHWCDDNSHKPMTDRSVINYLKQHQDEYKITYTNNISSEGGKTVRGFKNINVLIRPDRS